MNAINDFGMDTITLAGSFDAKLDAMKSAGFTQVMLGAGDLATHPGGVDGAVSAIRQSGLRPTGFQVLRDFEGLSGDLHEYKVDIAKSMLRMCHALDSPVLLACSSTSRHATADVERIVRDLQKLATLALPLNIRIAYEALSWGRGVNDFLSSWDIVEQADWPNLGIGLDSFHMIAADSALDSIELIDPDRLFLVQLSDFMWQDTPTFEDRKTTARTFRVFPGEGVHTSKVVDIVQRLERLGYRGDYSFEVFNDDYQQLPASVVCKRAQKSAMWLARDVLQRVLPLPEWAGNQPDRSW